MINREVVKDAVYNAMKEKTFHTVVNTAFVNAIPIDKTELDSATRRGLANFSFSALEAAGGFSLLENAIERETDTFKHDYLTAVRDVCCESAMEVATRVAKEYYECNKPNLCGKSKEKCNCDNADPKKCECKTEKAAVKSKKNVVAASVKEACNATLKVMASNAGEMFSSAKIAASEKGVTGACESIRASVIDTINNSNFRDLVSIANEVTNDSIQGMIAGMKAVEHTEEAVRDYTNNLRLAIATEAAKRFDPVMESEDSMMGFIEALEAEDEKKNSMIDENDPEYAEMMEAKKAHQEGTDQADDILDEDDPDAVKSEETKPDEFDEELNKDEDSDEDKSITPEVIRHGVPLKKLVADAKMTDEEYEKFASRIDRLDIPAVTNIVNDRVITAMKAEKETYQLNDEANKRLKDAIASSKDENIDAGMDTSAQDNLDDTSFSSPSDNDGGTAGNAGNDSLSTTDAETNEIKESLLAIPMKHHVKDHTSVYSKLQSTAIESLLAHGVTDFTKINFDIMRDITLESTFDIFPNKPEKSFSEKMERVMSLKSATEGFSIDSINKEDLMTVGTAMCTIIFTLLQTLHTMNLVKFTPTMAKQMCEDNNCGSSVTDPRTVNNVSPQANAALEEQRRAIAKCDNIPDLESIASKVNAISNQVQAAKDRGATIDQSVESAIVDIMGAITKKMENIDSALESISTEDSSVNSRYFSADVAAMDNAARAFRNVPVDQINFKCTESVGDGIYVNIVGMRNRTPVKETTAVIKSAGDMATENYIGLLLNQSALNDIGMSGSRATHVVIKDGKRITI